MSLELKIGDVILVPGQNWVSRIIKKVTKSDYSHVGCYIGNGKMVESAVGGVQISTMDKYPNWTIIRHKFATEEQLYTATSWMKAQVGAGYDYAGLLGIGLSFLFQSKGNVWDMKKRYWCSELVADGYFMGNININTSTKTWKVSPEDFYRMDNLFEEVKNGK